MSDNWTFDVCAIGEKAMADVISIAWVNAIGKATHYRVLNHNNVSTLVLLRNEESNSILLPYPITSEKQALEFITGWLSSADYGIQPDHDGDNKKGWRIFNEAWTHVAGMRYAILGVQPCWMMYGK